MKYGYKKLYIGGELMDASDGGTYDIICPGNKEKVAQIAWATKEDALLALEKAKEGYKLWSGFSIATRRSWIDKLRNKIVEHRDELRDSIMSEMGKTWTDTDEDLTSIINSLAYYTDEIENINTLSIEDKEGTHDHEIIHQPVGVVAAFISYNFPLLNLGFKLGPAIAAGCSIIIKPSEFSPLSAYIIGELCASIDFPPGVINIICGDVDQVGIPLSESKIPRLITMIGSTETAQKLISQSSKTSIKRYSMECGGNAPFIVMKDANIKKAIEIGAALKLGNAGQICVAPNRFLIHESIMSEFCNGLMEKFKGVKLGYGREEEPDMGPLANEISVKKLKSITKQAIEEGGKLIIGGDESNKRGHYFEPTIIVFDNASASVLDIETFGPIAFIIPFSSREEALLIANDTSAGLASYVFSKDDEHLNYFKEGLEFGEVQLNDVKYDIYLPHGGIKDSGIGVDCSARALDDYLIRKRVSRSLN